MDRRRINAASQAATRKRMQEAGFYETTVFVHEKTRDVMDAAISQGRFKSRREAMEHAIASVFRAEDSATPR